MEVIATGTAKFAKPGTRKSVTHEEAKALVALKQAQYPDTGAPLAQAGYQRRDMIAAPASSQPARARVPRRGSTTAVPAATTARSAPESDGEA